MNADELFRHFERVVDAPDAVPRLRAFCLRLALQGKLTGDGDQTWAEAGILECLESLDDGKKIHQGWSPQCEGAPSPSEDVWGVLRTTAIQDGFFLQAENKRLPDSLLPKPHLEVRPDDILLTCAGPRARCGIVCKVTTTRRRLMISGKMYRFRADKVHILPEFLALLLRGEEAQRAINLMKTGSSESGLNLTQDRFSSLRLRFGTLAEQHRIVAKVDELMALCDQLEAARSAREATRDRLTAASLERLNVPDPDPATFEKHARFALDALPTLTARADQIKQIRQTILNLAVRGKLVPQDPNDEPATELLRRIHKAKLRAREATGDHRIQNAPEPSAEGLPMELLIGWGIQSFENLFLFIDYRGQTPPKTDSGIPLITAKNIRMGRLNPEPREFISDKTYRTWMTRGFPALGDLFFTTEAPLANVCVNAISEPFALAQRVICLHPYGEIDSRYLMFVLMSDLMQLLIEQQSTGLTAKGIKAAKLKPLPIPIAPLTEQRRIVAKVDELMALCDRLEASIDASDSSRRRLLDSLLAESLTRDEPPSGSELSMAEV